jgi:hypothetical protein
MKYAWLEKLASEGHIRPEALDRIYKNCGSFLGQEKTANEVVVAAAAAATPPSLINFLMTAAGFVGVAGALGTAASFMEGKVHDVRVKAKTDMVRAAVLRNPRLITPKDREKADARFNEILKFAPSLGANEAVMSKMVMDKLQSGLTNQDVQNLIGIQVKMTPNPLDYSAMSAQVKTASVCGDMLADIFIGMEKEANIATDASKVFPSATLGNIAGHILRTIAPALTIAGGIAGVQYVKGKIDEKNLRSQLEMSFHNAIHNSPELEANPDKAKNAFMTLAHFAPHVASEPNAARSFMQKLVAYQAGPNASDLKDVTEVEKNLRGTTGMMDTIDRSLAASGLSHVLTKTWHDTMAPYQEELSGKLRQRIYEGQ